MTAVANWCVKGQNGADFEGYIGILCQLGIYKYKVQLPVLGVAGQIMSNTIKVTFLCDKRCLSHLRCKAI